MYTKKELHGMQARIDEWDAAFAPKVVVEPPKSPMKIWHPDEGIISIVGANKDKEIVERIYNGSLQYQFALLPKKDMKPIGFKSKRFNFKRRTNIDVNYIKSKNYIVYYHKAPLNIGNIRVVNLKTSWYRENVAGWRRNPEIIFDRFDKASMVISGKSSDLIKYSKSLKTEQDRDLNIYYEYNKGNVSLDDVLDRFQLDIINGYDDESIHLSGPAGTGKSVVAGKIYENLESKIAIVPNEELKKDYGNENAHTYKEFSSIVKEKVASNINDEIKKYNVPSSMLRTHTFFIGNGETVKFNWLNDRGEKFLLRDFNFIRTINEMSKQEITFIKTLKKSDLDNIHALEIKIENIYDKISDMKIGNFNDNVSEISNTLIRDFFDVENMEEYIVLDEAPILHDFPILFAMAYYANRVNRKFILAYDIAQHKRGKIEAIRDIIDIKDTYKLNIVFRTTKQIFEVATEYMDEDFSFKAPISIEGSVTFTNEPKYEKIIKFSDVINDVDSIIGAEFDDLSILIDKPLLKENYYLYYILCTRAIKNLNIVKSRYR